MALEMALRVRPDLIVSDVEMLGLDGTALCRKLQSYRLRTKTFRSCSWPAERKCKDRNPGAGSGRRGHHHQAHRPRAPGGPGPGRPAATPRRAIYG